MLRLRQIQHQLKVPISDLHGIASIFAAYSSTSTDLNKAALKTKLMNELRSIGFSTDIGRQILSSSPDLLSEGAVSKFAQCFAGLRTFMPTAAARSVIRRSPSVCLQEFSQLIKINEYVVNEMGIQYDEMIKCRLFEHDLDHIRCRHQFMYRAGLYELPNYSGETRDIENPPLKTIIDTSDAQFLEMCGLTTEEYRAFKNIMHLEDETAGDDEDDFDTEDYVYSESGEQLYQKKAYDPLKENFGRSKRRKKRR